MDAALRNALTPTAVYGTDTTEETDMTDTTETRSITNLRRVLIAESEDCHQRRQAHRPNMKSDPAAFDAYEGLVGTGIYAWLIAGILGLLGERHPETAATVAEWVEASLDSGMDWLESLNDDLDGEPATTAEAGAR